MTETSSAGVIIPRIISGDDHIMEPAHLWTSRPPQKFQEHAARIHVGLRNLDVVGVDNAAFGVDYPHTDSTWPDTRKFAQEYFAHVPQATFYKCGGNPIKGLRLDLDQDLDDHGQPLIAG